MLRVSGKYARKPSPPAGWRRSAAGRREVGRRGAAVPCCPQVVAAELELPCRFIRCLACRATSAIAMLSGRRDGPGRSASVFTTIEFGAAGVSAAGEEAVHLIRFGDAGVEGLDSPCRQQDVIAHLEPRSPSTAHIGQSPRSS